MTTLTREQRAVVRKLLRYRDRQQVQTLGGYAGTGKTTLLRKLADALPGFAACAFTGKAAHVLHEKGLPAATIHRLIYHALPASEGGIEFRLRAQHEIAIKGFLVDEASMVSQTLHRDLLSFGLPIIYVDDHGQLPPVGSDGHVMAHPDYRLETIHRNAGPIAYFAEHLRNGGMPKKFHADGTVKVVQRRDITDDTLLHAGQMICAYNRTRVKINEDVQRLRGRTVPLEKGDRVICLRNSRDAGLFNGQQGRVVRVHRGKPPRLDLFSSGVLYERLPYDPQTLGAEKPEINFNPEAPHPFDYAWIVTAHKAQGSEWNNVLVFEPGYWPWERTRWTYTAASRAKRSLIWVVA